MSDLHSIETSVHLTAAEQIDTVEGLVLSKQLIPSFQGHDGALGYQLVEALHFLTCVQLKGLE